MLTVTDMFCGAGGSTIGAVAVPGIEVRTAMNHWKRRDRDVTPAHVVHHRNEAARDVR